MHADTAGNAVTQSVNVTVAQPVAKVAELVLSTTDVNHNPISTLHVGDGSVLVGAERQSARYDDGT